MGPRLILKRFKSEGLAHFSYFIGSEHESVIIDPRRDSQAYIDLARKEEMKITHVLETHRHEDFVTGSLEVSHLTGATIHHGPGLAFEYGETIQDEKTLFFGKMKLTALHTPGHTDESISYALAEAHSNKDAIMVFTGDTLFSGDVGRTDLYGPKETPRLAKNLFNSIFNKILPLGDAVTLCPAHGAGSVCGGAISDREWSTLGYERLHNPALQKTLKEFVKFKTLERLERPPYFKKMEQYNLKGPPLLRGLPEPPSLTPNEFQKKIQQGALILDTRTPSAFGGSHIKGSYSIWLQGVPAFAGWVLPYDKPILLVLENKKHLKTAVTYLIRIGYDQIGGYLCSGAEACGLESWYANALPTEHLRLINVHELKEKINSKDKLAVLDVRTDEEWEKGHIENAIHIYVGHLKERLNEVPEHKPIAVVCSVGNRSSIGASILKQTRRQEVYNVLGGMSAWQKADYSII
jgi:hydroxyacylglutathione hydrolase